MKWILVLLIVFSATAFASAETEQTKPNDSCSDALDLSKDINAPVLIKKVDPDFRNVSDSGERKGTPIIAQAVVTKEGTLSCIKILRSSDPALDKIFSDALAQWRYKPASKKGKPVAIRLMITVAIDVR